MTATIEPTSTTVVDHPLTPLSADEIREVRRIVDEHGLLGDSVRFVYAALEEPHKDVVLAFRPGDAIERRARIMLLDRAIGKGTDAIVSITDNAVVYEHTVDPVTEGQVPILDEEFGDIEAMLLACDQWVAAIRKRDLDPEKVRAVPLSAGAFGHADEVGKPIAADNPVLVVAKKALDSDKMEITSVIDHGVEVQAMAAPFKVGATGDRWVAVSMVPMATLTARSSTCAGGNGSLYGKARISALLMGQLPPLVL